MLFANMRFIVMLVTADCCISYTATMAGQRKDNVVKEANITF